MNKILYVILVMVAIVMITWLPQSIENSQNVRFNNVEEFEADGFLSNLDATYLNTLGVGTTRSIEYSSDSKYLAIGIQSALKLRIYEYNVATECYELYNGTINTGGLGSVYAIDFSDDDKYLMVGHTTSPYLQLRNVDTGFSVLNDSDLGVNGVVNDIKFYNDNYVIVGGNFTDYIQVFRYDLNGDFIKLDDNIDILPSGNVTDIDYNNGYLHVTSEVSPYLLTYRIEGDNLVKIDEPSNLPSSSTYVVDSTDNNDYVAVGFDSSPYVRIYKFQNETFTDVSLDIIPVQNTINHALHFVDNTYLYLGGDTEVYKYKLVNDVFVQQTNDITNIDFPVYVIDSDRTLTRLAFGDSVDYECYTLDITVDFNPLELEYEPVKVNSVIQNSVSKNYSLIDEFLTVENQSYNEEITVDYEYVIEIENELIDNIFILVSLFALIALFGIMYKGFRR